jgi:hypothetical protein
MFARLLSSDAREVRDPRYQFEQPKVMDGKKRGSPEYSSGSTITHGRKHSTNHQLVPLIFRGANVSLGTTNASCACRSDV